MCPCAVCALSANQLGQTIHCIPFLSQISKSDIYDACMFAARFMWAILFFIDCMQHLAYGSGSFFPARNWRALFLFHDDECTWQHERTLQPNKFKVDERTTCSPRDECTTAWSIPAAEWIAGAGWKAAAGAVGARLPILRRVVV